MASLRQNAIYPPDNKFWFSFIGGAGWRPVVRNVDGTADDDGSTIDASSLIRPSWRKYIHVLCYVYIYSFPQWKVRSSNTAFIYSNSFMSKSFIWILWMAMAAEQERSTIYRENHRVRAEKENPDLESRELEKWMTVGKAYIEVVAWCYEEDGRIKEPPPFDLLVALHMRFNFPFHWLGVIDYRRLVRLCHSFSTTPIPYFLSCSLLVFVGWLEAVVEQR